VHVPQSVVLLFALSLVAASCGGDSGSTGTTAPDNTPVAISMTPSAAFSVTSGATTTFTASATARDGRVITNASIVWTSANPAVAAMTGPLLTAIQVGTTTITATSGSVSASVSVTVTPGAVQLLVIRTQPVGAIVDAPLATQPVVEFQDAAGNRVTSSTNFVTAAIASGGGTLGGTPTVAAVGGVVTFTNLRISGSPGPRTLSFTAGVLTTLSSPLTITAPPAPFINADNTVIAFSVRRGSSPTPRTINITNGGSQPLVGMSIDVAYDAGQPTGWLSPTLSSPDAPATLTINVDTTGVVEGTYHAIVHVNGPGASNSPLSVGVTLTITPNYSINYGTSSEKVRVVDVGGNFAPTVSIVDTVGRPVAGISLTFTSRAPTVATVGADGRVTAVAGGDVWIVASSPATSDSVFVIVPRSPTAPVIRSDATTFAARVGDTLFVNVVFDARSANVGAAELAVELSLQSGSLSFFYAVPTSPPVPLVNVSGSGLLRISVGSATGMNGNVRLLNLKIIGRTVNTIGWLNLYALDVSDTDGNSLTAQSSSTRVPFVIR
jgi:hypothetical protein